MYHFNCKELFSRCKELEELYIVQSSYEQVNIRLLISDRQHRNQIRLININKLIIGHVILNKNICGIHNIY